MRRNKREDERDRIAAFETDYELISKAKFWFGHSEDVFKHGLVIEWSRDGQFAYIYRKRPK